MSQRIRARYTRLTFPYFSPACPSPLPSTEAIHAAPLLNEFRSTRVARLSELYAVKYGPQVNPLEGENMIFVRQNTAIRVPEVYAIYQDSEKHNTYIIMEYIPGETLASIWGLLDEGRKGQIVARLYDYMKELRALPSPGYFGTIGKRPLLEPTFWTGQDTPLISGPFETEAQLNNGIVQKYLRCGGQLSKADFYRRSLAQIFRGHQPVFTHADFQRKNFLIRFDAENNVSVTMIDWKKSGWLPSYWEFAMAMIAYHSRDDWDKWVGLVLEPFQAEYNHLGRVHWDIWS